MKVPILVVTPPPEFGALKEDPRFLAEAGQARDFSYVPGFSDLRRQRDKEMSELARGLRPANTVTSLPVNLRWARCQNKRGDPDTRKPISHGVRKYRTVTKEDLGQPWFTELPAGAIVSADGTIRNGDTQLMVCDAEAAARNEFYKRLKTEQMLKGAEEGLKAAIAQAGGKEGYIRQEPASPTRAVFELETSDTVKTAIGR